MLKVSSFYLEGKTSSLSVKGQLSDKRQETGLNGAQRF